MTQSSIPTPSKLPIHPRKPYIQPASKPLGKAESMTIVAGFRCTNGVILAADSLISFPPLYVQKYESKIFRINPELGIYLTYSDDSAITKAYVRELRKLTEGKNESEAFAILKESSKRLHAECWTNASKADRIWISMLVTIRQRESVSLYSINGNRFAREENYAIAGIGFEQAHAFAGIYYRQWMNMTQADFTARYVLYQVKKFVKGCGGDTEVQKIDDLGVYESDSIRRISLVSSAELEQNFAFFDREILPLLIGFGDLSVTPKDFRKLLKKSNKALEDQRAEMFQKAPKALDKYIQRTS